MIERGARNEARPRLEPSREGARSVLLARFHDPAFPKRPRARARPSLRREAAPPRARPSALPGFPHRAPARARGRPGKSVLNLFAYTCASGSWLRGRARARALERRLLRDRARDWARNLEMKRAGSDRKPFHRGRRDRGVAPARCPPRFELPAAAAWRGGSGDSLVSSRGHSISVVLDPPRWSRGSLRGGRRGSRLRDSLQAGAARDRRGRSRTGHEPRFRGGARFLASGAGADRA